MCRVRENPVTHRIFIMKFSWVGRKHSRLFKSSNPRSISNFGIPSIRLSHCGLSEMCFNFEACSILCCCFNFCRLPTGPLIFLSRCLEQ